MSFILEALKKSEQQRQQKNASQQKVRKRTLSQPARRKGRWPYGVVAGGLGLALFLSWWFYGEQNLTSEQPLAVRESLVSSAPVKPVRNVELSETKPPVVTTPQKSVPVVVLAPVPRDVVLSTQTSDKPVEMANKTPEARLQPAEVSVLERASANNDAVTTVVIEPPQSQAIEKSYIEPASVELPLYLDLSRELREKMPRLAMSMHYFISDPARRMVRINNLLLHEGDWVSNDLQVVEITATGATLDLLGKLFEMRSASR